MSPGTKGGRPGRAELVDIRTYSDPRGKLSVVEEGTDLAFAPKRLYYLYGNNTGATRGAHAHKELQQLFIAMAGAVEIVVDNGSESNTYRLSSPDEGLILYPVVWRDIRNMSADAVLAVLASEPFDEADYIRDYEAFSSYLNTES
jgi:dTDP-4-dehydrorhamnose 3,5-epimerase-like enzyme